MRFEELSNDKDIILNKILGNQELCKAINYNELNFLDQPNISPTSILVYDRIFPHFFIPSNSDNSIKTYVTMSFRNYRPINGFFKAGYIYIHVFTHKTLYRTAYGYLRTDFLLQKIDNLLNDLTDLSIGKLSFEKMDEYIVNEVYSGNYIVYKTYDFN